MIDEQLAAVSSSTKTFLDKRDDASLSAVGAAITRLEKLLVTSAWIQRLSDKPTAVKMIEEWRGGGGSFGGGGQQAVGSLPLKLHFPVS